MGTHGKSGMALNNIHEVLGHATPEMPRNAVGRHRLVRSLQQRFGPNFRSLPGVKDIMKQFDGEVDVEKRIAQLKQIRYTPPKKEKK
jgi:hypothetical protein